MSDLSLRPATSEDREFLWSLYQATMAEYVREGLGLDDGQQKATFESHLDLARAQIVNRDGRSIGVLTLVPMPWGTLVQQIAVLPELQGQGIGSSLLRSVIEQATQKGQIVGLTVLKCNPAWKLYLRLGFRIMGSNETHYRMATERRRMQSKGVGPRRMA